MMTVMVTMKCIVNVCLFLIQVQNTATQIDLHEGMHEVVMINAQRTVSLPGCALEIVDDGNYDGGVLLSLHLTGNQREIQRFLKIHSCCRIC